ncbi:RanGTP-binding domain containing protein [Elaphomyces granulatus]
MEVFLTKLTQQAINYAIRSGIAVTASYAVQQSSRLLKNVKGAEREELLVLQERLQSKIKVISPAIDMIELIAARGNTSLESAVSITKALRFNIQSLAQQLEKAAAAEELRRKDEISSKSREQSDVEIKFIIEEIKKLLYRIEDAVPLMNLAISTSGASLSTSLPATVSPSRLLQASTFLTACDTQYSMTPSAAVQVGPTFTLSMYMLFASHLRPQDEGIRETTWKEVIHKARLKLRRVPMDILLGSENDRHRGQLPADGRADEFAYQVLVIEDLNDGRVHAFEDSEPEPRNFDGISPAGIREFIPVHQISKIFYADTGKMLKIGNEGEVNYPVLLLRRDTNAIPPRRMIERDYLDAGPTQGMSSEVQEDIEQTQLDAQLNGGSGVLDNQYHGSSFEQQIPDTWRLPPGLDPEWFAFEVYREDEPIESDSETEPPLSPSRESSDVANNPPLSENPSFRIGDISMLHSPDKGVTSTVSNPLFNKIRTSLSLLETLLRLTSLQQFQQQSHLSITDELLNFFLEESSTTGAGGDEHHRQRIRAEARRKVGWDPYDESPLKRRGEDYQYTSSNIWSTEYTPDHIRYNSMSPSVMGGREVRAREHTPEPVVLPSKSPLYEEERTRLLSWKQRSAVSSTENRRGSLTARPTATQSDEGLGTSPGSMSVGVDRFTASRVKPLDTSGHSSLS